MTTPTGSCGIAFKEWAGVCEALGRGRQTILLRKGGISEDSGAGAFVPDHPAFWLFPTAVHQAQQGLRAESPTLAIGPTVPIRLLAQVEHVRRVVDEASLPALENFHILTPETVRNRFHYREPGLWVLVVRIWRREAPIAIETTPEQAGCKTWVTLDHPLPVDGITPVLNDREWAEVAARLASILDGAGDRPAANSRGIGAA